MLAARHLRFTAQASHPAVAARQVPTPSALLQALVVHQAVALPVRVVAAKRLQQTLLLLPVANHLLVLARIAQAKQARPVLALVNHAAHSLQQSAAFSSISQTGGCPYISFFPTEQSKQYKV
ncbi:MAG: hypothetical protein FIO02_05415 [Nitrosopumilales archaeon]|nr:hypothetical protein [Nitrosopumilales archaeon]